LPSIVNICPLASFDISSALFSSKRKFAAINMKLPPLSSRLAAFAASLFSASIRANEPLFVEKEFFKK
jgi:hypothetical protein